MSETNTESTEEPRYDGPSVPSPGVSAVPTPGAVSDLPPESEPEQTDNTERPEDGKQNVSQSPDEIPEESKQ